MGVKTVLVCETQVPFVRGGAELLVEQLVSELRQRGVEAERVVGALQVVSERGNSSARRGVADARSQRKQRPPDRPRRSRRSSRPISCVIRRKVCWLVHQHRAAYELCGTVYSDFAHEEMDVGAARTHHVARRTDAARVRRSLHDFAERVARGCRRSTACRRRRSTTHRCLRRGSTPGPYGDYVLSVARVEGNKRVALAVRRAGAPAGTTSDWSSLASVATRTIVEKLAAEARRARSGHVHGRVSRTTSSSRSIATRWRWSTCRSTRTMGWRHWRRFSRQSP